MVKKREHREIFQSQSVLQLWRSAAFGAGQIAWRVSQPRWFGAAYLVRRRRLKRLK